MPVRLVRPTIIKTAPTFPISTSSGNNGDTIVLTQRSPRTSQRSYRIERTSTSRSPRTSDRQIIRVESTRSAQLPVPLTPPGRGLSRPTAGPLQGSSSPRTSTGRVQFIEPSRLAATMLVPTPERVIPHHRRSASQVIVINRSSSQRLGPVTPRISDSLLVNSSGATYAISRTIAPTPPLQREARVIDIEPRTSRASQVSTEFVEIETAGGRRSRRHSNVRAICTDGDPRGSGTWRPVRERYVVVDSKGGKTEYYR